MIFASLPGMASPDLCRIDGEDSPKEFSQSILRNLQLAKLENDPSDFCDSELAARYLFSSDHGTGRASKITQDEWFETLKTGKVAEKLESTAAKDRGVTNPWVKSLIPSEKVRQQVAEEFSGALLGRSDTLNSKGIVDALQKGRCSWPQVESEPVNENDRATASSYGVDYTSAAEKFACSELIGVLSINRCTGSFETIKRVALPSKAGLSLTGIEIYNRVLNDARYDEGLKRAALTIVKKQQDGVVPKGDYFGDLKSSFLQAGTSEKAATEMAWNVAALISTSGPNLTQRLTDYFDPPLVRTPKALSLVAIAQSLPVLDHRSSHAGQLYSFPPEVRGRCNTGKSYHFWYTAYLARRAALENGDSEAAAAVAFQTEKFYHLKERRKVDAVTRGHGHTPGQEIVRADLAYAAAGAAYGVYAANNSKPISLDVDRVMKHLLKKSDDGSVTLAASLAEAVTKNKLVQSYNKWTERFSPNTAFETTAAKGFPKSVDRSYLDFERSPTSQPPCAK
jgi:hypothetical protein